MLKPISDNIVIKMEKTPESVGKIFIGRAAAEREVIFYNATIIATGPGRLDSKGKRIPTGFSPGEKVLVSRNGIACQVPDQKDLYICQANAIAAKGWK